MPDETVSSAGDERTVNNTVRHNYRVLSEREKRLMIEIKDMGLEFLGLADEVGQSREVSLAKTKIEEAVMWMVKGLTA